ncbi:MAG: nucleotidyltransferase family protein [Bacteroidales bacterium]|nr:nucleotidyltransferase family protein [Bacteroidales bacterium]
MVLQAKENKAMILAAGLGSRLRPMTDHKPKALLEWEGKPLLEHLILKLKAAGFTSIIINVHHFADMILEFVKQKDHFGIGIEFSHEKDELLDTGGGIAHASSFFGKEPFLVYNVDILSNIDLRAMYRYHLASGALATLAVKQRVTSRSLLMSADGLLKGWRDNRTGETILSGTTPDGLKPIAFSAIHIMDPGIFELFPKEKRFPLMPFYLELANTHPVHLYRHDQDSWTDMGKMESYT